MFGIFFYLQLQLVSLEKENYRGGTLQLGAELIFVDPYEVKRKTEEREDSD